MAKTSDGKAAGASAGSPCETCDQVREADHRIANHLAMLAGYVRLKAAELGSAERPVDPAAAKIMLAAVGVQLDLIASLHRGFLSAPANAWGALPVRVRQLCEAVRGVMSAGELTMALDDDFSLPAGLLAPITQAVAEALINAVKHGARPGGAPAICVRGEKTSEGYRIAVSDEGPGIDPARQPPGTGMKLMRSLCAQAGATLAVASSAAGLTVTISVPAPSPTPN